MSYLRRAERALDALDARGLRRTIRERGDGVLDFTSNDYLGLSRDDRVIAALHGARRAGAGGARLLAGAHPEHRALEETLATLVRREAALLFSSGYLAALGAAGALAACADAAYSDALNHASLIDGLRATKLPRTIYPHLALPRARASGALVVTETLFGMDGDAADVAALAASLAGDDLVLLDEAHAIGTLGASGGGLAAGLDDPRIVILGTLSKALGALGGFVAGPRTAIELLRNTARTFLFDTALPPAVAAAANAAVAIVVSEDGRRLRERLASNAHRLREALARLDLPVAGMGPVLPIVVGDALEALEISAALEKRGLRVPAIRPPTVPAGTARLRISVRADHSEAEIDGLSEALASVLPRRPALL
jgi:8-amino-7-oxononanoate synthase